MLHKLRVTCLKLLQRVLFILLLTYFSCPFSSLYWILMFCPIPNLYIISILSISAFLIMSPSTFQPYRSLWARRASVVRKGRSQGSAAMDFLAQVNFKRELTYPICLELLTEPLSLDCGHTFCWDCITAKNRDSPRRGEQLSCVPVQISASESLT